MTTQNFQEEDISIKEQFLKLVTLINNYLKTVVISLFFGFALGLTLFLIKKPIYFSSMIISTGIIDLPSGRNLILTLQNLIDEKNFSEISKKLSLEESSVKKLKRIKLENIFEVYNETETKTVKISVEVTDIKILPNLQKGILKYLENNPYVKKRIDIKIKSYNAKIFFLQNELDQIEKLKNDIVKGQIFDEKFGNVMLLNPFTIYKELVDLFDQKLQSERDLLLVQNFQIIEGFTPFQKPVSPKLGPNILFGVTIGLTICITIIVFDKINKLIKNSKTGKSSFVK